MRRLHDYEHRSDSPPLATPHDALAFYEVDDIRCHQRKDCGENLTYAHRKSHVDYSLLSWAHGGQTLVLPENVGIRMDMSGFRLQYHQAFNDRRDEFGWKIVFQRRPKSWYSAFIVHLGLYEFTIPANTESTTIRGYPSNCPSRFVVFAVMVHAHDRARWGSLNVTRGGALSVFFYSHEVGLRDGVPLPQRYRYLDDPFLILPGDKCEVRCNYNSLGLDHDLHHGESSKEEMCRLNIYGYHNRKLS
jgi:hypothetical protein